MKPARLLVVDDKQNFLALFRRIAPANVEVVCVSDGREALARLAAEPFDVVISDVRMPGADGLAILRSVRDAGLDIEVILMTAYGTIADAVKAMKLGAAEYLTKPFDPDDAVRVIQAAIARREVRRTLGQPKTLPQSQLIGSGEAMRRVFEGITRAAASDAPVVVAGESGTGKELVARTIHACSRRSERRFVSVKCGALGEAVEAELFGGSRRGTFEESAGGTIYLDEIDSLSTAAQAKVTRVLEERLIRRLGSSQEHAVDVRLIAATDIDLSQAVRDGRIRPELYDRLNVLTIEVPPLRARKQDIAPLANALLRRAAPRSDPPPSLTKEALDKLIACEWPGNVRQLETALAHAVASTKSHIIDVDALPSDLLGGVSGPSRAVPLSSLSYREALAAERERATRDYLVALLQDVKGNVTQAAERAGIERESFHRLMKRHRVRAEDFRSR